MVRRYPIVHILVAELGLIVVKWDPDYLVENFTVERRCGKNFSSEVFVNGLLLVRNLTFAVTRF